MSPNLFQMHMSLLSLCAENWHQTHFKEARKGFFGCYSVCETMKDNKEG